MSQSVSQPLTNSLTDRLVDYVFMNRRTRQVSYFLSSQYFSDGLRITLSILMPSLLLAQVGQLPAGIAISLGALSVSIADAPGPVQHRRNGMAAAVLCGFVVTLVTGFARLNGFALGLEIALFSFFFSMFAVFGNRATSVGTAALLVMILMLDRPLDPAGVVLESGFVLAGGLWYTGVSLLMSRLQPYRPAQQALGECIHAVTKFLLIKADFYSVETRLDDDYRRLVAQQVVVSEKQDAVRELLFKSRQFMAESDNTSRLLVFTFSNTVDLYEQIVAMYYDYATIRDRFGGSDVLNRINRLIRQLAIELDHIGLAVQSIVPSRPPIDITRPLEALKRSIDDLGESRGNPLVLKKVLVSLRSLSQRIVAIQATLTTPADSPARPEEMEYGRFVSHQQITWQSFRDNFTLTSSAFRHSARVAVAMLTGFVITQFLPYGHYSYWVLLTISVILKPAFSLTKQRNTERILGTFLGGIIGVLILAFVPNQSVQFGFLVLLMIGTYSAQRISYIVMVICVTPFVLLLFSFMGVNYIGVAEERLLDTLLGGAISLGAGYLLFPRWESEQLTTPMREVLRANARYVQLMLDGLSGRAIRVLDYKLTRKDVYVTSANLAAAFQRMVSEPKHKQRNEKLTYEFVVLNHILSANVATVTSALLTGDPKPQPGLLRPAKRALNALTESLRQLGTSTDKPPAEPPVSDPPPPDSPAENPGPDDRLLVEQLNFIQRISGDISKLVEKVSA